MTKAKVTEPEVTEPEIEDPSDEPDVTAAPAPEAQPAAPAVDTPPQPAPPAPPPAEDIAGAIAGALRDIHADEAHRAEHEKLAGIVTAPEPERPKTLWDRLRWGS